MPRYLGQADYSHGSPATVGVLLVNLGTPQAPTKSAVRRYLAEFLADPRIVEWPRWLWRLVLHGIVLRVRPARSAALYAKIWTPEGSPLLTGTMALAEGVKAALKAERPGPIEVRVAMRYGEPSISSALRDLAAAGARKLLVVPLFPQYSGTTSASVLDAVGAELSSWRWVPDLRFVADYHADPRYIEALARSVEAHWQRQGRAERLVLSFHGIPERYFRAGDPYLNSDVVFGVRASLVADYVPHGAGTGPHAHESDRDYHALDFDFVLAREAVAPSTADWAPLPRSTR